LSDLEKENLSLYCQEKYLEKWEVLFIEWEEASAMYILREWSVEISKNNFWSKKVLWIVEAEEILGEMAIFSNWDKRMATATAMKKTRLVIVLWFSIKEIVVKYPWLLEKIINIINKRRDKNKKST
jgi:CRP-like cAMP-binding protein